MKIAIPDAYQNVALEMGRLVGSLGERRDHCVNNAGAFIPVGKKGGSIITAFNSAVHAMKRICKNDLPCNSSRSETLASNRISSASHPLVGT
jgi:hypothetical protein